VVFIRTTIVQIETQLPAQEHHIYPQLEFHSKHHNVTMHAAVVNQWGDTPKYSNFDLPDPTSSQVRIKVVAAGLHTLVRSRAAGKHFSVANRSPPHIPGTDGVGALADTGELVYFNAFAAPTGSFAEEINVERGDVYPLTNGADPEMVAVLANPALSSWMSLTARAAIQPRSNFNVAIVGATGVSGQAAVQISKAMGAKKIVAIGKPGAKLEKTVQNGATNTIALSQKIEETDFSEAADVDVVLDYLWGDVTTAVLPGIVAKRKDKSRQLTWVQIGALAGDGATIPASLLRSANVVMVGSAPGSYTFKEMREQMPSMLQTIVDKRLKTEFEIKQLTDVEKWWNETRGPRPVVKP
jgi:NADPH:quinone reductase-like Zn-dependent oxidoreductase